MRLPPVRGPSSYTIHSPPEFQVVPQDGEQLGHRAGGTGVEITVPRSETGKTC